jgi:hypothetical protein
MTTRSVGAPEETRKRGFIQYSVLMTIADLTPLQGGPFSWDVPGVEYLFRVMSTIVVVLRPYFGWYERKSAACFLHVFFFHPGKPSRTPADEGRTTRGDRGHHAKHLRR